MFGHTAYHASTLQCHCHELKITKLMLIDSTLISNGHSEPSICQPGATSLVRATRFNQVNVSLFFNKLSEILIQSYIIIFLVVLKVKVRLWLFKKKLL